MVKRNVLFVAAGIAVLISIAAGTVGGQNQRTARGGSGDARTPQGKPDFNGIWQVLTTAAVDVQDHQALENFPAGLGVVEGNEIPYRMDPLAIRQRHY